MKFRVALKYKGKLVKEILIKLKTIKIKGPTMYNLNCVIIVISTY